ncbi:MAG: hypothetical protein ACR2QK_10365, partial [Acidimicrobiales bacterium]
MANVIAAGYVMNRLGSALKSLRVGDGPGAGLGQVPWADGGVGHGQDAATEAIAAWSAYAELHPMETTGQTLAGRWLLVDTVMFAVLGYALTSVAVLLIAHRFRRAGDGRSERVGSAFWVAGWLGVALAVVDLTENFLAWRVIGSGRGGPVDLLRSVTIGKWLLSATLGASMVVAIGLWLALMSGRRRAGVPVLASSQVTLRRLEAWAKSLGRS